MSMQFFYALILNAAVPSRAIIASFLILWTDILGLGGISQAQATLPITPSCLNTQINLSATPPAGKVQYDITGGTRPGGGTNLFHSFGEFGVSTNNIANFLNTPVNGVLPATSNILGRVTGGNISNIFRTMLITGFEPESLIRSARRCI